MDSANSSSLHSSSGGGGDDEFDSRTGSFSAFFHSSTATSASAASALRPAPPPSSSYPRSHHFLDSLSSIDSTPLFPPSPAAMASHGVGFGVRVGPSSVQPLGQSNVAAAATALTRGSKKRSRASRRAPTTVLTTDTSNFRAMVQEFTGIPSPPFAASPSSSFARARLDLFHSATAFRSCSDPPPPVSSFLFPRPFMQQVLSPSLVPISSASSANASATISNAIAATSNTISNAHSTTSNSINPSSSNSYQLPSSVLGLASQNQHLLDPSLSIQPLLQPSSALGLGSQSHPLLNPSLTFQSLLQPSLHAKSNLPAMPADLDTRPLTRGHAGYALNELGLPTRLAASQGTHSVHAAVSGQDGGRDRASPRPILIGNYSSGSHQRVSSNHKANYSRSSSSEFNAENVTDGVTAMRGEVMHVLL
ncbi:nuclear pore complex protein NUP62-like isoform X1 [Musa acuminata AAA Group]|uniref:nuclear pore complex protein NUP62-like isoform X1 n=1 Tax=Musa acuminata AAA Group TaxID=214697 RepID=UPI0031DFF660